MNIQYLNGQYVDLETAEIVSGKEYELNKQIVYGLDSIVPFGKYKGKTIKFIMKDDDNKGYSYIYWMHEQGFKFSSEAKKYIDKRTLKRAAKAGVKLERTKRSSAPVVMSAEQMFSHLEANLNERHFDHAFDEEDMTFGDGFDLKNLFGRFPF